MPVRRQTSHLENPVLEVPPRGGFRGQANHTESHRCRFLASAPAAFLPGGEGMSSSRLGVAEQTLRGGLGQRAARESLSEVRCMSRVAPAGHSSTLPKRQDRSWMRPGNGAGDSAACPRIGIAANSWTLREPCRRPTTRGLARTSRRPIDSHCAAQSGSLRESAALRNRSGYPHSCGKAFAMTTPPLLARMRPRRGEVSSGRMLFNWST